MLTDDDRAFLNELETGDELDSQDVERLRAIATRLPEKVQVVEQATAMKTMGAAPDGWSWDDLNHIFTGYYGGIKLQRGEPMLEQDGHILMFRQGEVSFTPRQIPIYTRLSMLEGASVLVVNGFKGERQWWTSFEGGKSGPMLRPIDTLGQFVKRWLKEAHANPIEGWKREQPKRSGHRQETLT
jgi:uncharacterized protein YfiM (DUF2279 family)